MENVYCLSQSNFAIGQNGTNINFINDAVHL